MSKNLLEGRKRLSELNKTAENVHLNKKDELLALKLQALNKDAEAHGNLFDLPLELIVPDPKQPRKTFHNIEALAKSIAQNGLIQPIVVKPRNAQGRYVLIVGERRYQAAKAAGMKTISCIIRAEEDASTLILQLLENDQRENVSPLEEAAALKRLIEDMKVSKQQVAKELGRDAAWVSIRLGLNTVSKDISALVNDGLIEDVRTLHELKQLESENPKAAKELIQKIRDNQLGGAYRQAISNARVRKNKTGTVLKSISQIEKVGERLILHVGGRHPLEFKITPAVWQKFLKRKG